MKLTSALLLFTAATSLAAQTASQKTTPHPSAKPAGVATTNTAAGAACIKLPELSPKVPAPPAGAPCAKHLYTITTTPGVKLDYISPVEGNSLKEFLGIEATSFSLDYIDTKIGTGQLAGAHNWYTINYTGYLTDGTKFDSSYDHGEPITIPYAQHQVIAGWDTGFNGMHVGGKRRLIIPYQLAYGTQGKGQIPAKATLIFDVELMSISEQPPKPKTPPAPPASPAKTAPATPPADTPNSATQPGGPPSQTIPGSTPANPATVPPQTDPTRPAAVPPTTTPKP